MRTGPIGFRVGGLVAACVAAIGWWGPAAASVDQRQARAGRILYVEGEPRAEMKFINRAMTDHVPELVTLQRVPDGKFLRLGVDGPDELSEGLPKTEAELSRYAAIVLGSIEASAFDAEQHRLLAAFVTDHGGGLLMLGGSRSFGAGGWDGTPISALLPVDVEPHVSTQAVLPVMRLAVRPTAAGLAHPALQPMASLGEPDRVWPALANLTSVTPVYATRPGATSLLTALDADGREVTVLAVASAGKGRTAAFPVQDSWLWQMQPKAVTSAHELFWQGLLAWLVSSRSSGLP